ncbi:MAG TPA: hypothetical protein VIM73_15660, partial [Polyangiaceae bacterium]
MNSRTNRLSWLRYVQLWLLLGCLGCLLFGCQLVFGDVEIYEAPVGPGGAAECEAGTFRCNDEYLQSCVGAKAGWRGEDTCQTADLCDPKNERCNLCKYGNYRCSGKAREACSEDGSKWTLVEECESAELCSPTYCGPCTPGEFQCGGEGGRVLLKCSGGMQWGTVEECATPQLCEDTKDMAMTAMDPPWSGKCQPPQCAAGEMRCDGTRLQRCKSDLTGWLDEDNCPTPELCLSVLEINKTATIPL